jgi:hypothetical protein
VKNRVSVKQTTGVSFAGVALGAAGLLFGGAALLNQSGQLASTLQNVAGTLKLNPSGYSRLDEGLKLLGDGTNGITLDPSGSISALTGAFNCSRFTQGVDIGLATMSLSNDQIFWKDGATSNMILGSNSLTVINNQPFTISNANLIANCNISASTFTEGGTTLTTKYALANAQSNYALGSTLTSFSNLITPMAIHGSNAHSNQTPITTYNAYSNLITPMATWGSNTSQWGSNVARWGSNTAQWGSNAHSNQTPLTTYNTYSNLITPMAVHGSNAHSNQTPITTYTAYSNLITSMAIHGSNAHSN